MTPDPFTLAGETFGSRLLLGTAGYPNQRILVDAAAASGCEIVTVSIRRISLKGHGFDTVNLLSKYRFLPNTAGCETARDAIKTAELAREALDTNWVKLEVIGDRETLYPDVTELIDATRRLIDDGFVVLPYCTDDPVVCQRLADVGAAAVMPMGSLIGSGMGVANPANLELICRALAGAGHRRCRHRHRVGRRDRHGARRRRRAAQHRGRQGRRSGADGGGHAPCGRGRPPCPSRRPHPAPRPRRAVEPAARAGRFVRALPAPLLVITDRHQARHPIETIAEAVGHGGGRWLLLRDKDLDASGAPRASPRRLAEIARRTACISRSARDVDLAAEFGASRASPVGGGRGGSAGSASGAAP